jgi:drug/metabolite transporter (DMT)-like permease
MRSRGKVSLQERAIATAVKATAEPRHFVLAFICLALSAVAMGAGPIFVRLADVGPYASAFWRCLLALPFLWIWARLEGRQTVRPTRLDRSAVVAGLVFAADLSFWHLAIVNTTVANATFLSTTMPIWVALAAWLFAIETIQVRTLAGIALCLIGGVALIGQSYGYAPERLVGDMFGVVTAVFFGSYVLSVRWGRQHHAAGRLLFLSTMVTVPCLFVIAWLMEPRLLPHSAGGVGALLALALIAHIGGQGLASIALGTLPATFSSLVIFIEAIAAALLGWLVFGEALGLLQTLGGVLILAGILAARPRSGDPGPRRMEP